MTTIMVPCDSAAYGCGVDATERCVSMYPNSDRVGERRQFCADHAAEWAARQLRIGMGVRTETF